MKHKALLIYCDQFVTSVWIVAEARFKGTMDSEQEGGQRTGVTNGKGTVLAPLPGEGGLSDAQR